MATPQPCSNDTLEIIRTLDAPPERVFRAWADPGRLAKWWGPRGCSVIECDTDLRVGGAWHISVTTPSGSRRTVSGVYTMVEPPSCLAFTWAWHERGRRGHESIVTLTFRPRGDRTELRLHQEGFESGESLEEHNRGWLGTCDCLEDYLAEVNQ